MVKSNFHILRMVCAYIRKDDIAGKPKTTNLMYFQKDIHLTKGRGF